SAPGTVTFSPAGASTTAFARSSLTRTSHLSPCPPPHTSTPFPYTTLFRSYQGDATHESSSSATAAAVTVTKHPTVTTVSCNPPAFAAGASTTCTATDTGTAAA